MNNNANEHRRFPISKIVISIVSGIITAFYLISALGWILATYFMARSGFLGDEATKLYQSLHIADHIIRSFQVLLIVVASVALLIFKKVALKLILVNIIFSLISFLFVGNWAISFLGGLSGLLLLIIVYGYAYFLNRRGFLH